MLQDEEEKKKREEEAKAIISGIGGTINTINYANLKGRTLTTKNENEQNFINRVNEANSIINSINQRKNVPAPSATTEEIEEGHRNVQPLLDLMDKNSEPEIDNTINTVQESSSNPNSNSRFRINGSKSKEEIDKQVKKANSQNVQANTSKNNSIVDKDVKIGLASKADMQNTQELSTSDIKGMEKSNELNEDIEKGGIDKFNAQLEVFLSSIYGGFKQTISGLANVVTTGLGLGLRGLAGASYIFGLEDTGKKLDETYDNVIKTGSDINETANYERTVNSQIDDEFTKTVGDVTNVISNMLSSQVIGYAIPSSVPGVVIQGISVGGNSAQEVLDENKDNIGKATLTGIAKGYTSYLTEKMFDANILTRGTGKTSIQKSVDKLISNRISSRLGKEVANKTVGIIGENAEELVEDNVDNLIDKLINNKDLPGFQEWWENTTETAKVTTISTLIMSMLGLGGESFHNKEVDMEADYWIGEAQKIIEQEDLAIHFNPSEVKTLDDVKDFFITRFTPDGEIANVVATKGKEIANPNTELNVKPVVVKDNITNYYNVIDEDTGIILDSTPYETTMEAQSGFTEKANKLSDIQLRDINQKIDKANYAVTNEFVRVINAAKEELSQITTADYKINQNTNVNNAQTTSGENTTNYNQEETNYVVQDINKVTEPFSKQENYSKDELADVWNNEVSNNNFDAYYDNNGNIGSYIAIEEEGRNIVVNQYDNQDNIVRSAVIPSDNGRYNSEDVRDTILKVASNTDLNPYIQEMATNFQDDLANTLPGERYKAGDTWTGQKRATTKELADIKDETGASWNKIGEVLDDIANGRKNNTKLARVIENKLDEALSQGYTNIYGKVVNSNTEYLEQKSKVYGRDFTQNNNDYNPEENMTEDDYRIFGMKKNKKETTNRQGLQLPNSESKVSNKSITQNRDIIKSIEKFEKAKENIDRETVVTIANSLDIKIKEGAEKIENTNMSKLAGKNKTPNIVTIDELFKDLTSKNIKEYRKEAESIANRLYRDKVVTIYDTQTKTEINKSGIEKTLSGNITKSKVQSINQLQDIIQEGIYGYTTYNPDDNNGILYHHFFTPVNYQNKNGLIRVVIREFTNDNSLNDKYYYHQLEFISNKKIEGINALPQINGNKEIKFLPSTKKSIPQKSQSVKNNARQNKTQKSIKSLQYIKTKYKNQTDQLNIFENKDNTIGINNLVVKQNLRNKGIGQNILNDIIDYADKKGKTITLTPTSQYLTKNRLTNWYKKNGFVENKGRNTNYSISDTMYRLPKNSTNNNIRSMKQNTNKVTDSQGRTLTKQQQEYFKNSKVRDENGNLLVMYHGTEANVGVPETSWFTIFDIDKAGNHGSMLGDGFYFTSNKSHAEQYAHTRGNIYETYLNIENPLELDYFSTGELAYAIRKINPYIEADIYKRDGTIDGYKVRRYLLDNGYDGIHSGNTYVAFNSNQIKNVTNTMPTEKQDIRYMKKSNNVTDNQGRVLSKQQEEYFKNSKVRDKNGNLKTVYHGTPYDFNTFNYNKLGENTSSLGAGFYFTDTKTTAEQYGNLKEVYVNITKPLSYGKTTMSKTEYQNFITEIDNETNGRYLEDYGSLDEALKEYDYGGDDIDLISAVQTASGLTWDKTFEILKETTGFDGIISDEGFLNKGETLYVAFNSNQIKNVTNKTPTPNKDIRFAKKNAKTPKVDGDILEPGQTNAQRAGNYIEQEIRKIEETGNWDDTIPVTKMTDIRKTIENYLGIGIQRGHFRQQAYGIYKGNRDVIRTKELKDMDTILHETGHALDIGKRIKIDKESISNELLTAVKKYGGYEAETRQVQLEEGFAEVIREYAIVPEQARIDYPQTVAVLEGIRQTDKDFNNFITTVQQQTYNYIHQNPENRGVSNISVGERTDRAKWSKEYVKQELMRNVWDKDWATKSVVNEIQKIKGKKMSDLKASENAYYLTRLSSGIGDKVVSMLSKGYIDENGNKLMPGLDNIGEILGNSPERFTDFRALITANRDLDYKARLQKTGIRTEDARAIREKFKNDQQLQESAKIFYDTADGVLQYVVNNGLLTQEAADSIRKSNAFYAPMQRVLNGNKNNVGRRGAVKDVIKATTGSELDIKDPLENLIVNSVNMIQQVENNNILKALYKQGEEAGMTGKIYDVIPAPMVKIGTAKLSTWENELKSQGVDITKIDLEKTIDLFAPDTKIDPNNLITSFINDNGNRVYLQFHDEILFNSLMNMDKKFMSAILNFNRKINMPLRYGATMANIGFAIPNMVSDTAQAAIFSEAGFIPVLDNLIGVMDIVSAQNKTAREFFNKVIPGYADRINTMYALYEQTGATSATRMSQYREQTQNLMKNVYGTKNSEVLGIKERFKPLKRFLDIMTYIPEISEQSTRFRVFEKNLEYYRKNGMTETDARIQAALQSRDATQDFGRTGNVTREINQLIPFSAARVGSAYTFAEKVKANPKRVAGRLALLMTLSTFIKAIGYDDDEIEELNQRKKNDNFVLKIGDQIITIKKPQGILRSIINFGEYIQDLFTGNIEEGKEGERLSELIQSAIMDNMPADSVTGLVPNMVAPVVENAINKDLYYNSDIVKSYDLELPDNEQYYDYNSQLAIWLGQIFNYSPAKIDNLISGYFAGLGTSVTNVIDWISGKMGLSPEEANMGAENNAVGKRFFVNVNSNSQSVDDVYTLKTELKKKENGDTITADETQQLNALEEATTNMAKLNKQIKEIKKSMTLSADEKAEQIRVLQEQKTDVARQALGKDLLYSTSSEIENMKFYPSKDTMSKNKRTLTLTTEMKKEYEQVASEYYEKYEKQGLYNKEKLEQIESKAKDYAKNYMFKKYKDKLQED